MIRPIFLCAGKVGNQATHIHAFLLYCDGISRKRFFLHSVDISLNAVGKRQNQRNSNDSDASCERGHHRPALLCHKIIQRQGQGCPKRHGGFAGLSGSCVTPTRSFFLFGSFGFRFHSGHIGRVVSFIGGAVAHHAAIQHADNACGIPFGQLRVVRHHDNQFVLGNLLEKLHNLHAGFGIQRAGRLVRQ